MTKTTKLAFGPGIIVQGVAFRGNRWVVSAEGKGSRSCPGCREASGSRHRRQIRRLQELPIQGVPATLEIRSGRWRCRNEQYARKTFALAIALPSARKTQRVRELVRLFAHAAGGRVSERLLTRLGMPVSDNAILRQLKSHVRKRRKIEPLRAVAIDDWSCRKGFGYGTIVVDLERRTVADVLKTRSAHGTAGWLKQHPGIEFVSRDRSGLYAQGIRKGAPSADSFVIGPRAHSDRRF